MRIAALLLLIASAGSLAVAKDPDTETEAPHTDIHKQLLSEFKFIATPREPVPVAPFLSDAALQRQSQAPEADDPDLVKMAPFTVRESRDPVDMRSLHAGILRQEADAHAAAILNKLGIGVYVKPVGKVYFSAATIFYIPVSFGFSF